VIILLSTLLVIAVGTVVGILFQQRIRKHPAEYQQPLPYSDCSNPTATSQRQTSDGGYLIPLHECANITTADDANPYEKTVPSSEAPYIEIQDVTYIELIP
jgi:hypothetical protein